MTRLIFPLLALLLASACDSSTDKGPLDVSVIGAAPQMVDANRRAVSPPDALLIGAVAQGLVAFDATGQIEPALAIRWDVSDDGLYYTFRLDRERAPDARLVARRLRAATARSSRNALKPFLGAIAEIVAVTPQVLEIRLRAPRPNLLQLLAQPELALTGEGASGPFTIEKRERGALLLRRRVDPAVDGEEAPDAPALRLRAETAARAVARFATGHTSLVLNGSFADLAIAEAANLPAQRLRFDPAAGLFGLQVARLDPFLADAANRRAIAMAIDRDRITAAFGVPGWTGAAALAPPLVEGLPSPARADWVVASPDGRRAQARETIAAWTAVHGAPSLRLWLPPGPGSRLLLAVLQAELRAVGVGLSRAASEREADLVLVDAVAPADLASWYLRRFACERSLVCSEEADTALDAARTATTLEDRTAALASADRIFVELTPFIPLATPLRWSLAAPTLDAFRTNARAVHPLHHLRTVKD